MNSNDNKRINENYSLGVIGDVKPTKYQGGVNINQIGINITVHMLDIETIEDIIQECENDDKKTTLFIQLEAKGKGFTCIGYYKSEGLKRYSGVIKNQNAKYIECNPPFPYALLKKKITTINKNDTLSLPMVVHLTEPSELYHVLYFCKSIESKDKILKSIITIPNDITSLYYPDYDYVSDLNKNQLNI